MENRIRDYQGADQLDLFPEATKVGGNFYRRLLTTLTVLAVCAVLAFAASAEEQSGQMIMTRGLICDTEAQVVEFVDKLAETGETPNVEGCGVVMTPVFITWEVTSTHENAKATVVIARFTAANMVQFGIHAWSPKAEVAPVGDLI